jgi:ATP-dependent Clp protease ATP-binding subunit ClpB
VDNVANLIIAGEVREGDTVLVDVGADDRLFAVRK